ncbi:sortase-like protein [Streptomyces zinciresistens K42]|uniref:Sortase-like protein n=1 Tax=Streptomyces zinciresistens K42 TaxID=700597 RepID=G2GDP2_9ACTN|nr:sortase-like protein [Streptomyces zinciresistens K42]
MLVVGADRLSHREDPGPGVAAPDPGASEAPGVRAAGAGSGMTDSRPGAPGPAASPSARPGATPPAPPAATPAPPSRTPVRPSKAAGRPAGPRPLDRSRATRIVIPYIGVNAELVDLRLDGARRLPAPPGDKPKLAGWFADGPSPGEQGTAVTVGHLDTATGPAVYRGLGELKRGRRVEVRRADGRTAVYTVDAVKTFEKDKFPNRLVYGTRNRPELRLITCGGTYDRRTGYSGNVVVFAHLTATREPPAPGTR